MGSKCRSQQLALLLAFSCLAALMPLAWTEAGPVIGVTAGNGQLKSSGSSAEINDLKNRLEKEHDNVNLHYLLANLYVKVDRLDLAAMEYETCVRLQPASQAGVYAAGALKNLQARLPSLKPNQSPLSPGALQGTTPPAAMQQQPQPMQQSSPRPQVTGLDFISAPPGQSVTIAGSGFSSIPGENVVTFAGVPAPVTSASFASITCIIPEMYNPQWNVPVVVKTRGIAARDDARINIQNRIMPNR